MSTIPKLLQDLTFQTYMQHLYYRCYDITCEQGSLAVVIKSVRKFKQSFIYTLEYKYTSRTKLVMDISVNELGRPLNNDDYLIFIFYSDSSTFDENTLESKFLASKTALYNPPQFHKNLWLSVIEDYESLDLYQKCEMIITDQTIKITK